MNAGIAASVHTRLLVRCGTAFPIELPLWLSDEFAKGATRLAMKHFMDGGAAVRDIAVALGVSESPWTIREDLAALKNLGLVRSTGWGRSARRELTGQ